MAEHQAIAVAAGEAAAHRALLHEAAIVKSDELVRRRIAAMKERRREAVFALRRKNLRMRRALQGVTALSDLAQTELKDLINVSGTITIWSGRIRLGGTGECGPMESGFFISLTAAGIRVEDYTRYGDVEDMKEKTRLFLSFGADSLIHQRVLDRIANSNGCNPIVETKRFESLDGNNIAPSSIMFQVLADCSDPRKLERYVMQAIKRVY